MQFCLLQPFSEDVFSTMSPGNCGFVTQFRSDLQYASLNPDLIDLNYPKLSRFGEARRLNGENECKVGLCNVLRSFLFLRR